MVNRVQLFALGFETALGLIISYVYQIGIGLGSRMLASPHFLIPAMAYFCIILFFDETKKVFMRAGFVRNKDGVLKLTGWFARNTFF